MGSCFRRGVSEKRNPSSSESESSNLLLDESNSYCYSDERTGSPNRPASNSFLSSQYHSFVGGAVGTQSLPSESGNNGDRKRTKPRTGPLPGRVATDDAGEHVAGVENDSGHSTSPSRRSASLSQSHHPVTSSRGNDLHKAIKEAYKWKETYTSHNKDFLKQMDKLFMDCQIHLSDISSQSTPAARKEADALVEEMIALRNHWGQTLLPNSVCNAFIRERVYIDLGFQHYRIDCAQFFEPVPFYNNSSHNTGELMKLYRFSVYNMATNEVVIRYFLERSNVIHLYHVLCYTVSNGQRGQIHPYGAESPSYWELRSRMISDLCSRFQNHGLIKT